MQIVLVLNIVASVLFAISSLGFGIWLGLGTHALNSNRFWNSATRSLNIDSNYLASLVCWAFVAAAATAFLTGVAAKGSLGGIGFIFVICGLWFIIGTIAGTCWKPESATH